MPSSPHRFLACLFVGLALIGRAAADESKPSGSDPAKPASLTPEDIKAQVQNLEANRFSQRQEATAKLFEAGKQAIPALAEAAQGESREAANRALDLLKRHLEGDNEANKAAAKEALEKISKGSNETAAKLAQQLLAPKPASNNIAGGPFIPGGIQIGGGQIQIQVQGVAGPGGGFQAKRMSVKNVNGAKEIESDDGEKKVKIKEDANGIKMEVTKKKDGKETTENIEAKNLDDLKKNNPDAAKIYDELNKGNGAIQGQIIVLGGGNAIPVPIQGGIQAIPVPAIPGLPINDTARKQALEQIEKVGKALKDAREQKKNLTEKELQDLQTQLEEAMAKLGK